LYGHFRVVFLILDLAALSANIGVEESAFSLSFEIRTATAAGARFVLYSVSAQTRAPLARLPVASEANVAEDFAAPVASLGDVGAVLSQKLAVLRFSELHDKPPTGERDLSEFCPRTTAYVLRLGTECRQ